LTQMIFSDSFYPALIEFFLKVWDKNLLNLRDDSGMIKILLFV
jgi:hypothetical protein